MKIFKKCKFCTILTLQTISILLYIFFTNIEVFAAEFLFSTARSSIELLLIEGSSSGTKFYKFLNSFISTFRVKVTKKKFPPILGAKSLFRKIWPKILLLYLSIHYDNFWEIFQDDWQPHLGKSNMVKFSKKYLLGANGQFWAQKCFYISVSPLRILSKLCNMMRYYSETMKVQVMKTSTMKTGFS